MNELEKPKIHTKDTTPDHCKVCGKLKGECLCGTPSVFDDEKERIKIIDKARRYVENCTDEINAVTKNEDGSLKHVSKLKVNLPTKCGLAIKLGVCEETLNTWADKSQEFDWVLKRIDLKQRQILQEKGLSGEYNPTIAKLILSAKHDFREGTDVTSGGDKLERYEGGETPEEDSEALKEYHNKLKANMLKRREAKEEHEQSTNI